MVFVIDASPDNSYQLLKSLLPQSGLNSQLISLSRNFGSFAAIRAGMEAGNGELFAIMAADLQEPTNLIADFYNKLRDGEYQIVLGERTARQDPFLSKISCPQKIKPCNKRRKLPSLRD